MVTLPMVFDPNQHAPATGAGKQLPVSGKEGHVVVITDSEMKETSKKDGTMLVLILAIQNGPNQGEEGNYNLNIGNASADAVRIALSQLSAICHAVGWLQPVQDVSVLYNKPFRVVVGLQKDKEAQEKGYTEVKKVMCLDGSTPGHKSSNGASAPAPAPGGFPSAPTNPAPQQWQQPAAQMPPQQAASPQQWQQPAPQQAAPPSAAPWTMGPPPQAQPQAPAPTGAPPWAQPPQG